MFELPPALQHSDFRRFWTSMVCSGFASQMVAVAVGWQVFAIHRSPFDLGLIGLAEFAPVPLLALPAGQLADRLPRATLVFVSNVAEAVVVGLLLLVTIAGAQELWQFVVLAALTGATAALGNPAARSLTPGFVRARTWTDRAAGFASQSRRSDDGVTRVACASATMTSGVCEGSVLATPVKPLGFTPTMVAGMSLSLID